MWMDIQYIIRDKDTMRVDTSYEPPDPTLLSLFFVSSWRNYYLVGTRSSTPIMAMPINMPFHPFAFLRVSP